MPIHEYLNKFKERNENEAKLSSNVQQGRMAYHEMERKKLM